MVFRDIFRLTLGVCLISSGISGLNSKLDFGDDPKPSLISSKQRSIPFKTEHVHTSIKQTDSLDNIGVVCTSTGCDSKKSDAGTQQVITDVLVHVESTVDIANKTTKPEEVPDIPIVLGTKDAGHSNNYPKNYPNVERGLQFHQVSRNFQGNNVPLAPVNIGDAFPSLVPLQPANLYGVQSSHGINVEMKPIVSMISLPDGYKYRTDGMEIKIPYFEPTYHKHYYGENSPPQYAYYPQRKTLKNPVAFNNIVRPTYSLPVWKQNSPNQNRRHDVNCNCQNQSTSRMMWYPGARNQVALTNNDPRSIGGIGNNNYGMSIDDKLGAIN